uniref:Retrotransposon protein n=1 Tax=Strongyloides venezuelensis TaxID=75913 RepID=A0A0K0F570_STRVS
MNDEDFDIVTYTTTRKPTTRAQYIDPSSEEYKVMYRKRDVQNIEDSKGYLLFSKAGAFTDVEDDEDSYISNACRSFIWIPKLHNLLKLSSLKKNCFRI